MVLNKPPHALPGTTIMTRLGKRDGPASSVKQADGDASSQPTETAQTKKKQTTRRKVNMACIYCRRSHMTCDENRPCQRWCVLVKETFDTVLNVILDICVETRFLMRAPAAHEIVRRVNNTIHIRRF